MPDDYALAYGTHAAPEDGRCAMEWVSYLAGEAHSDEPECVSPVLRAMCIALNDGLDDEPRQRLRPYLTRTIGTAGDGLDVTRAWLAMDWLLRVYTPAWLHFAGLHGPADRLGAAPPITDSDDLMAVLPDLEGGAHAAHDARRRAYGSPWPSRWVAEVAGALAAREAAWACAGAAAWAAARLGIGNMAGDHARAAARSAAGDAAAAAMRSRGIPAGAAGRAAAAEALAPTLASLTDSALDLLDRMLPRESWALPAAPAVAAGAPRRDRLPVG